MIPTVNRTLLATACALVTMTRVQADALSSREYRYLMGTSVLVEVHGQDADRRKAAIDEAFAAMSEVDRLMSNYRADSELTRMNREAATRDVELSEPLYRVLEAGQRVSRDSNGAFDMTVGPLVGLWGFFDKKPHLPSAVELDAIRPVVNFRNLLLDPVRRTARFVRPGVEIDLGGIAKGFAVEIAAQAIARRDLSGLVDAGGNQFVVGTPVGKTGWTFGIKNPDDTSSLVGVVEVAHGSVATSANYANFLAADGQRYGHLLDPRTLRPSTASLSVTILSDDATLADASTKAAFVLGPTEGLAFIDANPALAGLIVYRDHSGSVRIARSKRLGARFKPAGQPAA